MLSRARPAVPTASSQHRPSIQPPNRLLSSVPLPPSSRRSLSKSASFSSYIWKESKTYSASTPGPIFTPVVGRGVVVCGAVLGIVIWSFLVVLSRSLAIRSGSGLFYQYLLQRNRRALTPPAPPAPFLPPLLEAGLLFAGPACAALLFGAFWLFCRAPLRFPAAAA